MIFSGRKIHCCTSLYHQLFRYSAQPDIGIFVEIIQRLWYHSDDFEEKPGSAATMGSCVLSGCQTLQLVDQAADRFEAIGLQSGRLASTDLTGKRTATRFFRTLPFGRSAGEGRWPSKPPKTVKWIAAKRYLQRRADRLNHSNVRRKGDSPEMLAQ